MYFCIRAASSVAVTTLNALLMPFFFLLRGSNMSITSLSSLSSLQTSYTLTTENSTHSCNFSRRNCSLIRSRLSSNVIDSFSIRLKRFRASVRLSPASYAGRQICMLENIRSEEIKNSLRHVLRLLVFRLLQPSRAETHRKPRPRS
jgi:hypothetical protein